MRIIVALSLVIVSCKSNGNEKHPDPEYQKITESEKATDTPIPPSTATEEAVSTPAIGEPSGLFECRAPNKSAKSEMVPNFQKDAKWRLPFRPAGCPTIPPTFGRVTLGMTGKQAKKAAREAKPTKVRTYEEFGNLQYGKRPYHQRYVWFIEDKSGKIDRLTFKVTEEQFAELAKAWGEPVEFKAYSQSMWRWYDSENGYILTAEKETLSRKNPKSKDSEEIAGYQIDIKSYTPLKYLLGKHIAEKNLIGKTLEEIYKSYPDMVDVVSKEQAQAVRQRLAGHASKEALDFAGAGKAKVNIRTADREDGGDLIHVTWDKDQKVAKYSFFLRYGDDEKLKNEFLAIAKSVLGAPVKVEKNYKDELAYTFAGPESLTVSFEPMSDSWDVNIKTIAK